MTNFALNLLIGVFVTTFFSIWITTFVITAATLASLLSPRKVYIVSVEDWVAFSIFMLLTAALIMALVKS